MTTFDARARQFARFCVVLAALMILPLSASFAQTLLVPNAVTIYPGTTTSFNVVMFGANAPVTIVPTNLPTGVTVSPSQLTLSNFGAGTFTLTAALNADAAAFPSTSPSNANTATAPFYLATVSGGIAKVSSSINLTVSLSNTGFTPTAAQTNLPVVNINTSGTAITSQTTNVPGTITITSANGTAIFPSSAGGQDDTATFHVHGNSTALMPKKPYTISLNTSADLLSLMGLGCPYVTSSGNATCDKSKSYVLLANYDDKSLLRDWAASALANAIPIGNGSNGYLSEVAGSPTPSGTSQLLPWAPHSLFVELYVNGAYQGNYELIEQVTVDSHRVNIPQLSDSQTSGDLSGGYLMEIDHQDTPAFTTPQGLPIYLNNPNFSPAVPEQVSYIQNYLDTAETALFSSNFTSPTTGWRAYFDEASLVNFYIVNDLMGNVDGGDFYSSDYLYKTADNPYLYMGPVWDFDISAGNTNYEPIASPLVQWTATQAIWFAQLFKDPGFATDVAKQWDTLKQNGVFTQWIANIQAQGAVLTQSAQNNFNRWPILGETVWPNPVARNSYAAEVTNLTDWLNARMAYLDALFNSRAASSIAITSGPSVSTEGTPVTYQVTVTGSGPLPTGRVTLLADEYPIGSAQVNASGQATVSGNLMAQGSYTINVLYNGDNNYALSQSTGQPLTISAPLSPTVTTIDVDSTSFAQGSSPVLTAVVTGNGQTSLPTGTVLFAASGYPLGVATVESGQATITIPAYATAMAGKYSISAAYSGDATHSPSQAIVAGTVTAASAVPAPVFSRAPGAYATGDTVTITDAQAGAVIHYTTDGSYPSSSSATYSTPIAISSNFTLQAVAVAGSTTSPVTGAAYLAVGGVAAGSGFSGITSLTLNGSAAISGANLELINGGTNEAGSAWTTNPVSISGFTTEFQFQILNPSADGFTFALQGVGPNALGANGSGLGYQGIPNSIAFKFDLYSNVGEGQDSIGYYVNGAAPTLPAADLTPTGMNLHSGDVFDMKLSYSAGVLTATFTDTKTGETITDAQEINLPVLLNSNSAYAGFTAGSGGLSANINILNWTYTAN